MVTLRRKVRDNKLKAEPRDDTREPLRFRPSALREAGYEVDGTNTTELLKRRRELRRGDLNQAIKEVERLRAENAELRQRIEKVEGERDEARRVFDATLVALTRVEGVGPTQPAG